MAGSNEIKVTAEQITRKKEELTQENARLKELIQNLQTQNDNLSAMWEVEAKADYTKIVRDACTQFNNFGKQIDNYCRVLGDIAENYKRAEQENEQIAARR